MIVKMIVCKISVIHFFLITHLSLGIDTSNVLGNNFKDFIIRLFFYESIWIWKRISISSYSVLDIIMF